MCVCVCCVYVITQQLSCAFPCALMPRLCRNKVILTNTIGKLERKINELSDQIEEEHKLATEQKDLVRKSRLHHRGALESLVKRVQRPSRIQKPSERSSRSGFETGARPPDAGTRRLTSEPPCAVRR